MIYAYVKSEIMMSYCGKLSMYFCNITGLVFIVYLCGKLSMYFCKITRLEFIIFVTRAIMES